eukprot:NODE_2490_length_782_cov_314.732606_g1735_i0.p1 GENE.NODE_2490_length_782_cov_314.732606_g1735_i0~~NODE_2490_length_782_cov_314.732606_g1735_i0.p1  ORF type:complete len:195 (-),score=30.56 NODE_2490_length_782_cov_314.732606_g1735_i0:77-661(-)
MVKHNNMIPNGHFHKDWQRWISTWFNQPGRKKRRRVARQLKAERVAPRPVEGLLRSAVHPPSIRYNMKLREGRGFSLEELKQAGINHKEARSLGICVDHRRKNKSVNSLQENVQRLKNYMAKLVVMPKEEMAQVQKAAEIVQLVAEAAPRAVTAEDKKFRAFALLRKARADERLVGTRMKRALEMAEKENAKKK